MPFQVTKLVGGENRVHLVADCPFKHGPWCGIADVPCGLLLCPARGGVVMKVRRC